MRLPRLECTDHGVVLEHGSEQFGDQLGARDVWVFPHDDQYLMHYDAAGATGWRASLARSVDGVSWTKAGPILDLGPHGAPDAGSASYGTVFEHDGTFHMFYLGTPNVSNDGLRTPAFPYLTMKAESRSAFGPWTKRPDVTPFLPHPNSWFSDTASPGAIIRVGDGFAMIFSASTVDETGAIYRTLGVARTADLSGPWSIDLEPLLPLEEQIENSSLYFEPANGLWFLFTNHVAASPDHPPVPPQNTSEYTDAIWVYWSTDPLHYDPRNKAVVLDGSTSTWSPCVIGLPSVVVMGDRLAVYYDGSREDSISHGHRDIGLATIALPIVPPRSSVSSPE